MMGAGTVGAVVQVIVVPAVAAGSDGFCAPPTVSAPAVGVLPGRPRPKRQAVAACENTPTSRTRGRRVPLPSNSTAAAPAPGVATVEPPSSYPMIAISDL